MKRLPRAALDRAGRQTSYGERKSMYSLSSLPILKGEEIHFHERTQIVMLSNPDCTFCI